MAGSIRALLVYTGGGFLCPFDHASRGSKFQTSKARIKVDEAGAGGHQSVIFSSGFLNP